MRGDDEIMTIKRNPLYCHILQLIRKKNYLGLIKVATIAYFSVLSISIILIIIESLQKFANNNSELPKISDLASLGDSIGGISGPMIAIAVGVLTYLAFIQQVKANTITVNQFEKQNKLSNFYSLLNLHSKKVDDITMYKDGINFLKGRAAIGQILQQYHDELFDKAMEVLKNKIIDNGISGPTSSLQAGLLRSISHLSHYVIQKSNSDLEIHDSIMKIDESSRESLINTAFANCGDEIKENLVLEEVSYYSPEFSYAILKDIDENIYDQFGNEFGHYFRNMAQLLEFIASSGDLQDGFRRIFRAQLSRHEIALLAHNCLSDRTSIWFNELVKQFELFDDLYIPDLFLPHFESMLIIHETILSDKKRSKDSRKNQSLLFE